MDPLQAGGGWRHQAQGEPAHAPLWQVLEGHCCWPSLHGGAQAALGLVWQERAALEGLHAAMGEPPASS